MKRLKYLLALVVLVPSMAMAAVTGTLTTTTSPSHEAGQEFTVDLNITGSSNFTGFESTIVLQNLQVVSVTPNPALVFLKTPTVNDLSFQGGIMNDAATVKVMTVTLKGVAAGVATINNTGSDIMIVSADTVTTIVLPANPTVYTITASTPQTALAKFLAFIKYILSRIF